MSNDELLFQAAVATTEAQNIIRRAWEHKGLPPANADQLVEKLRKASAAAVELQSRAHGQAPAKVG